MTRRLVVIAAVMACSGDAPDSPDTALPGADPAASAAARAAVADTAVPVPPPAPATDTTANPQVITPDGWGALRIGMSRAEVVAAAGPDANPDAVGGPEPDRCDEFRPDRAPAGVLVMIERGVLTRISVSRNAGIRTPAGLRVGDADSAVVAAHGAQARSEPHAYQAAPARYITVWRQPPPGPRARGIRYEIDASGVVAHIRAGGSSIEYVEGCT